MRWRDFRILLYFIIAAVIFGIISWVTLAPGITWVAPVVALGFISIGLGINILALVNRTGKKIEAISETLKSIQQIQEAIQKEQKEQSGSRSSIVPTLQAFSELYLDYFARKKSGEEQQKSTDDV